MLPSEPPCSRTVLRRPRILLVDDDPSVLRSLWRLLRRSRPEMHVNAVSGVGQALEALSELTYDVVLTDLQMPGGGGQVVLDALLRDHPGTGRIVHSSQLESSDPVRIRKLAHVVLPKPATEPELLTAIESALQRASSQPTANTR